MDPFSAFFSAQFLFFALALFAVTFVVRIIVEFFWKSAKTSHAWNNLLLPLLPLVTGAIGGFFSKMYPDPLGTSLIAREVFGLTAGLCSGLVYKMLKGYVKSKLSGTTVTTTATTTTSSNATTGTTTNTTDSTQTSGMSQDAYPKQ